MKTIVVTALALLCGCSSAPSDTAPASAPPASSATAPADTCVAVDAAEETLRVKNDRGTIEGTLLVPEGCGPMPVALVIAGSGPTDRDGNEPKMYRLLAEALAERGIASFRYDKAGIGASKDAMPPMTDFVFERGADDAALLVDALRKDARFDRVVVVGHSEGSMLGILVASRAKIDGFVSLAGAGRPIGIVLREQLGKQIEDAALLADAERIISALEHGEHVARADVPKELAALFDPTVQNYLITWMKHDPKADLAAAPVGPTLIVQGTTDVQVTLGDAELLASARPDAKLVEIEGMNHTLKHATGATAAEQKDAYTNPKLPIEPALVDAVSSFVTASVRGPRSSE